MHLIVTKTGQSEEKFDGVKTGESLNFRKIERKSDVKFIKPSGGCWILEVRRVKAMKNTEGSKKPRWVEILRKFWRKVKAYWDYKLKSCEKFNSNRTEIGLNPEKSFDLCFFIFFWGKWISFGKILNQIHPKLEWTQQRRTLEEI